MPRRPGSRTLIRVVQIIKNAVAMRCKLNLRRMTISLPSTRRQYLRSACRFGQGCHFSCRGTIVRLKDMGTANALTRCDGFNKLDFSDQSNNWGTGLPLASQIPATGRLLQPLLANPALKACLRNCVLRRAFREFLRIRGSSSLFHMHTLEKAPKLTAFLKLGPSPNGRPDRYEVDAKAGRLRTAFAPFCFRWSSMHATRKFHFRFGGVGQDWKCISIRFCCFCVLQQPSSDPIRRKFFIQRTGNRRVASPDHGPVSVSEQPSRLHLGLGGPCRPARRVSGILSNEIRHCATRRILAEAANASAFSQTGNDVFAASIGSGPPRRGHGCAGPCRRAGKKISRRVGATRNGFLQSVMRTITFANRCERRG